MGIDRAGHNGEPRAVDDLVAFEALAHSDDAAAGHGDVGAGEATRADVDQSVAENELRRHYTPAAVAMSTIASPGAFDASAGLLKPSSCFAFAAERTSATRPM